MRRAGRAVVKYPSYEGPGLASCGGLVELEEPGWASCGG